LSLKLRGAVVAVVLAVLTGAAIVADARITVRDVQRMTASGDRVVHTHEVLRELQQLLLSLVDAETGERGFIITADELYLAPYASGRAAVERHLARLAELTRDDASQQRHLREIEPLVADKLRHLQRTVELRMTRGFVATRSVVLSGESRRLMDAVRASVARMVADEHALLEQRNQASVAAARRAVISTIAGSAVSLALLAFSFEVARRRLRERARTAVHAHEEKERFRTTLNSVGDAVVVTDERGNVTMLNPIAARLMRCGNEAIGQPLEAVFRIVNEETRRPVESPVRKVLLERKVAGLANHTVLALPGGDEVPIDDSAAPIQREDGTIVGVVLVFRDVRQRREAERAQQRVTALLREQDQRKDRFLAMLSHELRNPLSPMRNAVAVLRREDVTTERWTRAVEVMDRQVAHVSRLVDDLLDVSRIAQGKVRLDKRQLDLGELVHRSLEDFVSVFARRRIALDVHADDVPMWVDADATRLAQVTVNLLQNAAKFTDPGGRVTVALAKENERARLEVRDTGAGMDARTLSTLFQPFVQAEATIRRSAMGLGLGLALSKHIVELHGGTVRAASDGPGKGASFVIELPLVRSGSRAQTPTPTRRPSVPLRVLVIDDNEDAATTLRDLLELDRHEVLLARDGESGVALALLHRPDVVLCDVGLPGIDGYETARRLRSAGSPATLVALTGYATLEDVQHALEAGFHHHLSKPVDVSVLLDVLSTAAGAIRPAQPQDGGAGAGFAVEQPR
jgi:PAS domain S-box-containing protein